MATVMLASYALVLALLLLASFKFKESSAAIWFLRLLLFGMCYDNLLQAMGPYFIDASWYLPLNYPRYVLHAAVLPFLTLFALFIMRSAGIKLAENSLFQAFCILFTVASLAYGLWHEVFLLELVSSDKLGHAKLVSASNAPPLATILTNVLVMAMALSVWRETQWRWFFFGGLFIFLVNGATASMAWGFLAGNMAEIVFVVALLATYRHFDSLAGSSSAGAV